MNSTEFTTANIQRPSASDVESAIGYGSEGRNGGGQSHLRIGVVHVIVGGSGATLDSVLAEAEAMEAIAREALFVAAWLRTTRAPSLLPPVLPDAATHYTEHDDGTVTFTDDNGSAVPA